MAPDSLAVVGSNFCRAWPKPGAAFFCGFAATSVTDGVAWQLRQKQTRHGGGDSSPDARSSSAVLD
jgi:hypothetical protein